MKDVDNIMMSCELREEARPPTLLLRLMHAESATWLSSIFLAMPDRIEFDLTADSAVDLLSPVSLRLACSGKRSWKKLAATDREGQFVWIATPDDWETYAALLEPFIEGRYGHQYFTSEVNDDLLVEVSFGERLLASIQ